MVDRSVIACLSFGAPGTLEIFDETRLNKLDSFTALRILNEGGFLTHGVIQNKISIRDTALLLGTCVGRGKNGKSPTQALSLRHLNGMYIAQSETKAERRRPNPVKVDPALRHDEFQCALAES